MEFERERYDELLDERNLIAALRYLRAADLNSAEFDREYGRLVNMTLAEAAAAAERGERDRAAYWRAVLSWLLREVAPLGSLYREQLRLEFGSLGGLEESIRSAFGTRAGQSVERAVTEARSRFEDAARSFDHTDPEESLHAVFDQVERGLRDGLRRFQEALGNRDRGPEPGGRSGSRYQREGEPGAGGAEEGAEKGADDDDDGPVHEVKIENDDQ